MYKANDGKIFNHKNDCEKYEFKMNQIEKIMQNLPQEPDSCNFRNGGGYLQHDPEIVKKAMIEILKLSEIDFKEDKEKIFENPFSYRQSYYIGRVMTDGNNICWSAWCRFLSMDNKYREWGQPYFALNPDKGEQIRLN